MASKLLIKELGRLINISIRSGKFYSGWKCSKVLPGFKNKGSAFDAAFYRPIANLSEVSKLAERAVHQQVHQYLHAHGLIHPDHHGFLQNHSTTTALQQLVDLWHKAADNGKLSATILLDLRAGFDVINHEVLLQKLEKYRFGENEMSWFRSYLYGRTQCVQIESAFSSLQSVPWGIPQGSILGPLLFLIYINKLPDIVKHIDNHEENDNEAGEDTEEASVIVFADDNSTTTSIEDVVKLQEIIEAEGKAVTEWFRRNEISCSAEKTKLFLP